MIVDEQMTAVNFCVRASSSAPVFEGAKVKVGTIVTCTRVSFVIRHSLARSVRRLFQTTRPLRGAGADRKRE
jgi:hypothetical protein